MSTIMFKELQTLQADMVTLEGMVGVLIQSAYSDMQTVLIGNALEVLSEYLAVRSDQLDRILQEVCADGG